jgi:transposase-like protein
LVHTGHGPGQYLGREFTAERHPRRAFDQQLKAEMVDLLRSSSCCIGRVCRDLDLTETAVRRQVTQAEVEARLCRVLRGTTSGSRA